MSNNTQHSGGFLVFFDAAVQYVTQFHQAACNVVSGCGMVEDIDGEDV